jgi:hypothetical protein
MYVSRLCFSTIPGKGHVACNELTKLVSIIQKDTGAKREIFEVVATA